MNAKEALEKDDQVVLSYSHDKRQIEIEDGDTVTVDEAKELFDRALVADCNMAMATLCKHDFDMDAVERYYAEQDSA